jgi:hypothetical protein
VTAYQVRVTQEGQWDWTFWRVTIAAPGAALYTHTVDSSFKRSALRSARKAIRYHAASGAWPPQPSDEDRRTAIPPRYKIRKTKP